MADQLEAGWSSRCSILLRVPVKKLSTQMTLAPCVEQPLAQMRAEKAGAAGDQDALFEMHGIKGLPVNS